MWSAVCSGNSPSRCRPRSFVSAVADRRLSATPMACARTAHGSERRRTPRECLSTLQPRADLRRGSSTDYRRAPRPGYSTVRRCVLVRLLSGTLAPEPLLLLRRHSKGILSTCRTPACIQAGYAEAPQSTSFHAPRTEPSDSRHRLARAILRDPGRCRASLRFIGVDGPRCHAKRRLRVLIALKPHWASARRATQPSVNRLRTQAQRCVPGAASPSICSRARTSRIERYRQPNAGYQYTLQGRDDQPQLADLRAPRLARQALRHTAAASPT